jgi:hypothetical protein
MIRFPCPVCQRTLKALDRRAGRKVYCPHCCRPALVPRPSLAVARGTSAGQTSLDGAVAAKLEQTFRRGRLGGARGRAVWEGMRRGLRSEEVLAALGGPERLFAGDPRAAPADGDAQARARLRAEALKMIRRWRNSIAAWIKVNTGQGAW